MTQGEIIDEVIEFGLADWVMDTELVGAIREGARTADPLEVRKQLLEIVTTVVNRGLAELGDTPHGGGGFRPWGLPLDKALERIIRRWDALPRTYPIGSELFWLCNTPLGDEEAKRIQARWAAEGLL